jgi:hypothetical protein
MQLLKHLLCYAVQTLTKGFAQQQQKNAAEPRLAFVKSVL